MDLFTIKTSFAFRLFAVASPEHLLSSFISQLYSSFSILSPTNNSFNLSFDHCVAFFSFQCQLFGFVAGMNILDNQ
jgi:hypothetical protein